VADDFAVAAAERDLAPFRDSDHAEAVILVLKYPALIVEWRRPSGWQALAANALASFEYGSSGPTLIEDVTECNGVAERFDTGDAVLPFRA
jgi:hypothetical protein